MKSEWPSLEDIQNADLTQLEKWTVSLKSPETEEEKTKAYIAGMRGLSLLGQEFVKGNI